MKIALIYDRVNKFGGAERVLLALHQLWPNAPLYTAVYNPPTAPWAKSFDVRPSWLNKLPLAKTHHELYPWLTPLAFESFKLDDYDVVISITSAEAKAVITQPSTLHICYCLTPTRYLWSHHQQYLDSPGLGAWSRLGKPVFKLTKSQLKKLDLHLASRPDKYLAISKTVQARIKQYYHRSSEVIYPPVDFAKFSQPSTIKYQPPASNYFLLVSRLTSYKQISLAISAFNQLKQNLIIVGSGREQGRLKRLAGPTIHFLNQVPDNHLVYLYQHSQALIMPQLEDFGIVALEAQAAGKPVIALQAGGALETVIANKTGLFFKSSTVDSLIQAVKQFKSRSWDKKAIQAQAKNFDTKFFKQQFKNYLETQWQKHQP